MSAQKKKTSINLLVKVEPESDIGNQFLSWALTYGRYIIIVVQIFVLSVFFLRFKLDRDHTDLQEAVSQKQALVQSVSDLENEIRRIQKKLTDIRSITTDSDITLKLLRYLEDNTPVDTIYSTLSYSNSSIRFIASAKNLKNFNFLLRKIQENNNFSDVLLEDLVRKADGRVEFRIQAKINPKGFT